MDNQLSPIIDATSDPTFSGQGTFLVGSNAVFFFDFPDADGDLYDPSNIDITIKDTNGSIARTAANVDKIGLGQYAYAWQIPSDTIPGTYKLTLEYTAETTAGPVDRTHIENFIVGEKETAVFNDFLMGMVSLLDCFIGYTQRIPIYDELGTLNRSRTEASFSFERWNQPSGVKVFVNGELASMAYTIDYNDGKIIFPGTLSPIDEVSARYNFRWFTDNELVVFINGAISIFNQYPPQNAFNASNLPDRYRITAVLQASVFALRRLIMDLQYQEPKKIFGGFEQAESAIRALDELKKNYEGQLKDLYDAKLKQPYVGLTHTVTVPEFTLPGGRSRWFRYLFKGGMIFFPYLLWLI